jgi:general stress protein 26
MSDNNQNIENLSKKDAIKKMKELVKHNMMCMFTTRLTQVPLQARPMAVQEVDDEGVFWFFSDVESDKNFEIAEDSRVQLFFGDSGKSEYLSVYGHAMTSVDPKRIDELWHPMVKTWFQGGKDDPNLTLLMVIPDEAYYWDTKNNKMVALMKIMASVVSGKTMDDGVEGRLKV